MDQFADRLAAAVRRCRNPVCVGLDPRWEQLPNDVRCDQGTTDVTRQAEAYAAFCRGVIDVVGPLVPIVKPQAAFFEELGPPGMQALAEVIRHAQDAGLLVILDAKRGDIGSTAVAYARGFLGRGRSPWSADALTVNPYLGPDTLEPFVETAVERGAGIFVLVKTSNPGSVEFQDLSADGRAVYRHVAEHVERMAAASSGTTSGYGAVGAVVGATYPKQLVELRAAMLHTWILVPGYGSQGGKAADVASAFDSNGLGAVVNNSRGIIFAHRRAEYAERHSADNWQTAVEAATREMIADLQSAIPALR